MNDLNDAWNEGRMADFFDALPDIGSLMRFSQWRREQPDPNMSVEVENRLGSEVMAAVILSPSIEDEFARQTRVMLRNWARVFVTGKSPMFNESRYFNAGIEEALKLGSKWIVVMCDDMEEREHFASLLSHLLYLDNKRFDTVWINETPDHYHSCDACLTPLSSVQGLAERLMGNARLMDMRVKYQVENVVAFEHPIAKPFRYWLFHTLYPARLQHPSLRFRLTGDFCILSSEWCRANMPVLDDRFIGNQDVGLSLRLAKTRSVKVDFTLGSQIGGHYKPSLVKAEREVFNMAVLNELIREARYR